MTGMGLSGSPRGSDGTPGVWPAAMRVHPNKMGRPVPAPSEYPVVHADTGLPSNAPCPMAPEGIFSSPPTRRIQGVVATPRPGGVSMTAATSRYVGKPPARRELRQRFWEAIGLGYSSDEAARMAGVASDTGKGWFNKGGGMRTVSPHPLSGRYLSFAEREEIAVLVAQGLGVRAVARTLGRSPSSISRSCIATRRGATTGTPIGPVQPKRTPIAAPDDPRRQSSSPTTSSGATWPSAWAARSPGPGRRGASRGDVATACTSSGAGPRRGAPSRSLAAWWSTSPMMSRCGSPMRPSTRPSMSKAAGRCGAS